MVIPQKLGCLLPGARPARTRPRTRRASSCPRSSPKIRNRTCRETAHRAGNCRIINEKRLIGIFLQPSTDSLAPWAAFLLYLNLQSCTHEPVPAGGQPNPKGKDHLQEQKTTKPLQQSHQKKEEKKKTTQKIT